MKGKLITITVLFSLLLLLAAGVLLAAENRINSQDVKANQVIAVNEIEQLARQGKFNEMSEKSSELQEQIQSAPLSGDRNHNIIWILCGACIAFFVLVFGYVYFAILRPFEQMKQFTEKIAQGNFEIPLDYSRSNYFGAFTWAFDSMRREITKARSCEREAIENNQAVIATLSHDIKTPIASIRAYTEGLEANLDGTLERREKYLSVIMKKCDEVAGLTNDLFLHSLSNLDKLKINLKEQEICGLMENIVHEIAAEHDDVHYQKPAFTVIALVDQNRLTQLTENLINNARKYAKTDIDVFLRQSEHSVSLHFRDRGLGIPDADMPFVFGQFYRGKNCGKEQGSGLGLYIVKYIAEQMHGSVALYNHTDGLEVIVDLPVA